MQWLIETWTRVSFLVILKNTKLLPQSFQMILHGGFKCNYNSIHFDNIPNTTRWNASLQFVLEMDVDTYFCLSVLTSSVPADSNLSSLHKLCCLWFLVLFLFNLAYLNLFSQFPFFNNGFLTAKLPLRLFLMRLRWTKGLDAPLRSCVKSLLDISYFLSTWLSDTAHLL